MLHDTAKGAQHRSMALAYSTSTSCGSGSKDKATFPLENHSRKKLSCSRREHVACETRIKDILQVQSHQ